LKLDPGKDLTYGLGPPLLSIERTAEAFGKRRPKSIDRGGDPTGCPLRRLLESVITKRFPHPRLSSNRLHRTGRNRMIAGWRIVADDLVMPEGDVPSPTAAKSIHLSHALALQPRREGNSSERKC
jgi:hypothetical protein